ncbi:styrene monooxygenase/indole monooxygenase family protein [Azotobacter vinelandii]|uniref:styrene monooxygenase/indole monooxygenase family protein n=1 Tax=Azotobacter vinelandii TaxID=354 RepID=UPI0007735D45|nr:styrene monooxygenase/indole monooxygenase family protein [Azotobacter vinelandii]
MKKPSPVREVTIVGAGQAGLVLAIGLRRLGHRVRLILDRPAAVIAAGRILSGQCVFAPALAAERELGLDLWSASSPRIGAIHVASRSMPPDRVTQQSFVGKLRAPAESVDQRIKFPALIDMFIQIGGCLEIMEADVACLERYALESELLVVAVGKGRLASLFPVDPMRSPFSAPARTLAMVYLRGAMPPPHVGCVSSTAVAGAGTVMHFPALTHGGHCEVLLFEAMPGGPLDVGCKGLAARELLAAMRIALAKCLPEEGERIADAYVTDPGASLSGSIVPTVRHGVARLPSGRAVLGLGDAVVLNDPLVGQGANNAIRMAMVCLRAIAEHEGPFDDVWLAACASRAWQEVSAATIWTNMALRPSSVQAAALMRRATLEQAVADRVAQGFEDPASLLPLLLGLERA